MKALTISNPYAELIANGTKQFENRKWWTAYRGKLAIHAGKGTQYMTAKEMRDEGLVTGAVVAVADLVGCIHYPTLAAKRSLLESSKGTCDSICFSVNEIIEDVHAEGPYCFVLDNVHRLKEPVPATGKQGFWNWGPSRFKRSRTKGSKLPENTVCVTRPGKFGNPFSTYDEFEFWVDRRKTKDCKELGPEKLEKIDWILDNIDQLKGKNLACFCDLNKKCHADVLLELALERKW